MKKLFFFFLFTLFLSLPNAWAQQAPKALNFDLELDGDHKEEHQLLVPEDAKEINLEFKGKITGGKVKVLVYNPKGRKENSLGLNCTKGKSAKGELYESQSDPMPGIWTIKIDSSDAIGKVKIKVNSK